MPATFKGFSKYGQMDVLLKIAGDVTIGGSITKVEETFINVYVQLLCSVCVQETQGGNHVIDS